MVNIMFGPSGVSIMSMDTSKTSLVRLILTPAFFEAFECTQPMVFGIYTETLSNVLQKAKQSTLHWKATDDGALTIVLQEQDFKTEFTLRSISIDDDQLDIPEMQAWSRCTRRHQTHTEERPMQVPRLSEYGPA